MKDTKNGNWYEVCVQVKGEIRDVIEEPSLKAAKRRADTLASQWLDCELIFVRQHRLDKGNSPGGSKFVVLHKLTLDFRPLCPACFRQKMDAIPPSRALGPNFVRVLKGNGGTK